MTLLVGALLLSGCGGDDDERVKVPAAGENTPLSTTPAGVEEGVAYDVSAQEWKGMSEGNRFDVAQTYIDDNPVRCEDARVADVAGYAVITIGVDFPQTGPVSEILGEGCDASRQS